MKSERNNIRIRGTPLYIYDNIPLNSLVDWKSLREKYVEKSQHIFYVQSIFLKIILYKR